MIGYFCIIGLICADFLIEYYLKLKNLIVKDYKDKSFWIKFVNSIFKYRIITIFTLVMFSTFKHLSVGFDTRLYFEYYTSLVEDKSLLFVHAISNKFEIGYAVLNSVLASINMNFRVLIFIIATFVSIVIILFINKVSTNKIMSLILYVALGVFAQSLSAYRQIIAMAFILLAIMFLIDKKWFKSSILIIMASTFHVSAIICMVLIPLRYLKPKTWLVIGAFCLVVVGSFVFPYILKLLEKISPLDYYTKYYIDLNMYIIKSDILNTLYSVALITLFLVMYISRFKLLKLEENDKEIYDFLLLIFMFVPLFRIAGFIVNMPQLFNRLNMYFFMILILLIPLFVKGLRYNKKLHRAATISVYVVAICFMVYLYAVKNSCGVYPFTFMF